MLFKRKEWKALEKEALAIEGTDPAKALELIKVGLADAPDGGASSPHVRLLEERIKIEERIGLTEDVEANRRELAAALEPDLARVRAELPTRKDKALVDALREQEDLLMRLGRPQTEIDQARRRFGTALDELIAKTKSHLLLPSYLEMRADLFERMGQTVDGARTRISAARVLRAFGGDPDARASLAVDAIFVAKWGIVGFEMGKTFQKSYENNLRLRALQIEMKLVEQGRAEVLGDCKRCGQVRIDRIDVPPNGMTYEEKKIRCPAGHKLKSFKVIVKEELEAAGTHARSG